MFEDCLIINHAVPGDNNHDIIQRTIKNVDAIKKLGCVPHVIVGLSEVGRGSGAELKLCPPDHKTEKTLNEYLKSLLKEEVNILNKALSDCPRYICSAWTTGVTNNKNIIDFITNDYKQYPDAFLLLGKYIEWFGKHRERLGITKQSLIDSINNSEVYIKKLLETNFVDESIHVKNVNSLQMDEQKNITTDIYYNFFTHVLDNMEQPS
tara:strand:+ start:663 stop:1286 length:624 start_codon:yes stop_codon:yes gene_type:complete